MKKNLIVTLANEDYIDQTKQLFSSVYFNAEWEGDYLLLSYKIPEKKLKWFRDKGILIKKCPEISTEPIGPHKRHPAKLSKFYLFTPEFKKWDNIVYLDSDIIVRASLNKLTNVKSFAASIDTYNQRINDYFVINHPDKSKEGVIYKKLQSEYNLMKTGFNSGVMCFNTDIIQEDSFKKLVKLFKQYSPIHVLGDQPTFNLFFYKKWEKLPRVYNVFTGKNRTLGTYGKSIKPHNVKGVILHIMGSEKQGKPWHPNSPFFNEWKRNLDLSELINLDYVPPSEKAWNDKQVKEYSKYLEKGIPFINQIINIFHTVLKYCKTLKFKKKL